MGGNLKPTHSFSMMNLILVTTDLVYSEIKFMQLTACAMLSTVCSLRIKPLNDKKFKAILHSAQVALYDVLEVLSTFFSSMI